ncbi:uncharacterized protein LOC135808924 isoform X3 [Sycon ciliatum]|uniref:uncharacterized protein LOC135808924 isoform X3 n=1 Tax=Sycon ciliatum TaxID=27933 RepID=UPI0031F618D8
MVNSLLPALAVFALLLISGPLQSTCFIVTGSYECKLSDGTVLTSGDYTSLLFGEFLVARDTVADRFYDDMTCTFDFETSIDRYVYIELYNCPLVDSTTTSCNKDRIQFLGLSPFNPSTHVFEKLTCFHDLTGAASYVPSNVIKVTFTSDSVADSESQGCYGWFYAYPNPNMDSSFPGNGNNNDDGSLPGGAPPGLPGGAPPGLLQAELALLRRYNQAKDDDKLDIVCEKPTFFQTLSIVTGHCPQQPDGIAVANGNVKAKGKGKAKGKAKGRAKGKAKGRAKGRGRIFYG